MRVRVCFLFALVPGVLAAQSFVKQQRLPTLDLSPKRWTLARPAARTQLTPLSLRQGKTPASAPKMFTAPPWESRPCAVDLRLAPHEADKSAMPLLEPKEKPRSRTTDVPARPCSEIANERK